MARGRHRVVGVVQGNSKVVPSLRALFAAATLSFDVAARVWGVSPSEDFMGRAIWLCAAFGALIFAAGHAVAAPACADGRTPVDAHPLDGPAVARAGRLAQVGGVAASVGTSDQPTPDLGLCVTPSAVFVRADALALGDFGPLAWALAAWHLRAEPTGVAGMAGCLLGRLGLPVAELSMEIEAAILAFPVMAEGGETTEARRAAIRAGALRCK